MYNSDLFINRCSHSHYLPRVSQHVSVRIPRSPKSIKGDETVPGVGPAYKKNEARPEKVPLLCISAVKREGLSMHPLAL